jgi:hypothetical protein
MTHDPTTIDGQPMIMPDYSSVQLETHDGRDGPKPVYTRLAAKAAYLHALSQIGNNVTAASQHAGIDRNTVRNWTREGFLTPEEVNDALASFGDKIQGEIVKRALIGVQKPLTSNGKIVKDEHGKIVYIAQADSRLLERLADKYVQGWYTPSGAGGIHINVNQQQLGALSADYPPPKRSIVTFDYDLLTPEERAILLSIAEAVDQRQLALGEPGKTIEGTLTGNHE